MKQLNKRTYLIIGMLSILLSSCSPYLNYFQTAQSSFNKAAEAENLLKTNPNASATVLPESNYRMARTFIMKAMGDEKDEKEKHDKTDLARDGLLLNAYAIKALSEWKLGMYQEAIRTSRACKLTFGNDQSVQNQRDYIIIMALESLIYNDSIEGYISKLDVKQGKTELSAMDKSSLENLMKGFNILKEQRADLAADHPVQSYLLISQLSLAKNWKNLYSKLQQQLRRGRSAKLEGIKQEMDPMKNQLNTDLKACFKDFAGVLGDNKHALYQRWKKAHVDIEGI
ncbi:MAG: hypothetical protein ACPGJS_21270 [Flammeovirgaceae bacterium]